MSKRLVAYRAWKSSGGAVVGLLLVGPITYWILYHFHVVQWSVVGGAVLAGIVGALVIYLPTLFYYWWIRETLEWPPRRIDPKMQARIKEHLRPYAPRIVIMYLIQDVSDAGEFGGDICKAVREAGWAVDVENTEEVDKTHDKGVWIYGRSEGYPNPPTSDLLQDAFRKAGIKSRVDVGSTQERKTCIVIG